ncbi:MAG: RidA family protein [Dehalococcoidia bacterium]
MAKRTTLFPDPFPYADYRRYTYAMGIATGDVIWVAGQLADEYDAEIGRMVCRGGLLEQTRLAFEKVRLILESAGAGFGDIVHQVDYITPAALESYQDTLNIRRQYFGDDLPVTTTVVVNRLLRDESLIEVEVVAVRGPSPRRSFPDPSAIGGLFPTPGAVQKGDLLFITAQPSVDAGASDVVNQAQAIYDAIGGSLKAAGPGLPM